MSAAGSSATTSRRAERVEDDQLADDDEGDRVEQHVPVALGDAALGVQEPQPEGQVVGRCHQNGVRCDLEEALPVNGVL